MKTFATVPDITPFAANWHEWDGKTWLLTEKMKVQFEYKSRFYELTISQGFTTDGGTIPRMLWRVAGHPLGSYLLSYLVHDALYASEALPRGVCDGIFLNILVELKAPWAIRNAAYLAVRAFGAFVWKTHTPKSIESARKLVSLELIY